MAKSKITEKLNWLKAREEASRNRFPTQPRTPTQSTLEQEVASELVNKGVGSDGGVSLPYNLGHATIAANGSAAQSSSEKIAVPNHIPGWIYALTTAGLVALLYATGAVTNVVPTPLEIARQVTSRLAPAATPAPATVTPQLGATPVVTAMPGLENILTEQQLIEYATRLSSVQPITQEVLEKAIALNETLYYKLTGNTLQAVKFIPRLMTNEEYKALENKPGGTTANSEGSITFGPNGETYLNVHSRLGKIESPLTQVFLTLVHETGNAEAERRDTIGNKYYPIGLSFDAFSNNVAEKYDLGDVSDLNISWIERESLQSLYRAATYHKLEELGIKIAPSLTLKDINDTINAIIKSDNFFPQATVVAWIMAINHPNTLENLQKNGKITSQQAISLFDDAIKNSQTREGLELRIVEVIKAVRNATQYTQRIKDAAILSQRSAEFVYFP